MAAISATAQTLALQDLASTLASHEPPLSLADVGLPTPAAEEMEKAGNPLIADETLPYKPDVLRTQLDASVPLLSPEQRAAYETIKAAVDANAGGAFFVDGPAGSGKTFLFNQAAAYVRSQNDIALACAYTGVAAQLLTGGRTAHARFHFSDCGGDWTCCYSKQTQSSALLLAARLIIIDEGTMMHAGAYEALHCMLCDIMDVGRDVPFGGKVVVVGGDFRQTLPVVPRGSQADTVAACLKSWPMWSRFTTLRLDSNIRVERELKRRGDVSAEVRQRFADHAAWVRRIGDGVEPAHPQASGYPDGIRVPDQYVSAATNVEALIHSAFGGDLNDASEEDLTASGILTPLNDDAEAVGRVG